MKKMKNTAVYPAARIAQPLDAADVVVVSVCALRLRACVQEA